LNAEYGMRQAIAFAVLVIALTAGAFAQPAPPAPVLRCYEMQTQTGVVARRDFPDEHGFIVREICKCLRSVSIGT
jgi:hypothetical protein